jgi:NADPH:quinone reductase
MREFGRPSVFSYEDIADPAPGPSEVVIEVEAANITFVETQVRAGRPPNPAMLPRLPAILGNGVGGMVAELGGRVAARLRGQRVVASLHGVGGYAERAVADADALIPIPDALGTPEAVALLADGRTALLLMRAAAVGAGETVLVEAAAGGVGSLLVQLASAAGARVVAAAGSTRKLELASELGADVTVDYAQPEWERDLGAIDVVFDGVGGGTGRTAFLLLQRGGRFCAFGMSSGSFADVSQTHA